MDGRVGQQTHGIKRKHKGVVSLLQEQTTELQLPLPDSKKINHSPA